MNYLNHPLRVSKNKPPYLFEKINDGTENKLKKKKNRKNSCVLYRPSKSICIQINTKICFSKSVA